MCIFSFVALIIVMHFYLGLEPLVLKMARGRKFLKESKDLSLLGFAIVTATGLIVTGNARDPNSDDRTT